METASTVEAKNTLHCPHQWMPKTSMVVLVTYDTKEVSHCWIVWIDCEHSNAAIDDSLRQIVEELLEVLLYLPRVCALGL